MNDKNQRRAMNFATILCYCLRVLGVLGAGQVLLSCPAPVFAMSDADEIRWGRNVARDAEKQYGGTLPPGDAMAARVRRLGKKLAALSTRKNIPFSYKVLRNDKVLNAFAAPGGPIFITRRLVRLTSNDAELVSVLGHETAHIDRRHLAQTMEKRERAQNAARSVGERVLGKGKARRAIVLSTDVAFAVWSRGYSRDNESESDRWGARWMSRLGFDPRASISILRKISGGRGRPSDLEKYLSTHLAPGERHQALSTLIARENLLDVARQNGGPKLWSDDGVFATKEDELARRSNGQTPATKPVAKVASREKPSSAPTPDSRSASTASQSEKRSATTSSSSKKPTRIPTNSQTTTTTQIATKSKPEYRLTKTEETNPPAAPISPRLPVLLFCGGAFLFFAGSLWYWHFTRPQGASTFAASQSEITGYMILRTSRDERFQFQLTNSKPLVIGRDPNCDLPVDDAEASFHHAQIRFDGKSYLLFDCNSTNGSWLGEHRVSTSPLSTGDTFRIGQAWFVVEGLD